MMLSLWVLYSCNILERQETWQGGFFRHQPALEEDGRFAFWDSDQCISYENADYWQPSTPQLGGAQLWAVLAPVAGCSACVWWMIFWLLQWYGHCRRQARQTHGYSSQQERQEGCSMLRLVPIVCIPSLVPYLVVDPFDPGASLCG